MKRIISCVLVCLMFIVLFKPAVFADGAKSGDFSYFGLPNSRWSLDSQGTLIFSGTKVPSYKYVSQPPWMPYANEIKKVIISEGIRELENISLNGCWNAEEIYLPSSLENLAYCDIFYHCESVKHLTIPSGVTVLGSWIFEYCYALKSIYIPKSVSTIGSYTFRCCNSLKEIYYEGTSEDWAKIRDDGSCLSDIIRKNNTKIYYNATTSTGDMYEYLAKYYPQYLNNSAVNSYLSTCNNAAYRTIESYSDETVDLLSWKEAFDNSEKIIIQDIFAKLGWGKSLEQEWREKNVLNLMKTISQKEYVEEKAWKRIKEQYKDFKFVYSFYSAGQDVLENFADEIAKCHKNSKNPLTKDSIEKILKASFDDCEDKLGLEFFGSSTVSKIVDGADITLLAIQLYDVELETIDILMENIRIDSELYIGLQEMKENLLKNPAEYVLNKYLTKNSAKILKNTLSPLVKVVGQTFSVTDLLSDLSTAKTVIELIPKIVDKLYTGAEIDEIYGAITAYSFYQTIHSATTSMLTDLMNCKINGEAPSDELIENYKLFYKIRNSAMINYLKACESITKYSSSRYLLQDLQKNLGDETGYISFYNYIRNCETVYREALRNGTVSCGHEIKDVTRVSPNSCTRWGYTGYRCRICFTSFIGDRTQPYGHSYISSTILPACEEQGYTLNKCTKCNAEEKTDYVPEVGHTYNNSNVCSVCGYVDSNISVIGAYVNRIDVKKYIKDNSITLQIEAKEGYDLPDLTMYIVSYDENNKLIYLKTGRKILSNEKTMDLSAEIPISQKCKIMLWTSELQPLIKIIVQ